MLGASIKPFKPIKADDGEGEQEQCWHMWFGSFIIFELCVVGVEIRSQLSLNC